MFDSLYNSVSSGSLTLWAYVLIMVAVSVVCGLASSMITSVKLRSSKGFFVTTTVMPAVVSTAFIFLNVMLQNDQTKAISAIAAIMVGMGLIRFRSAQGKAEEMIALFVSVVIGAVCGLGYIAYAILFSLVVPLVFIGVSCLKIFQNKRLSSEKILKITIPDNLEYNGLFDKTFEHFLKEVEQVGVKTTGMGSMFRLSYRIVMKNPAEEKEFIDELRIKNGNLEISVLPYTDDPRQL